MRIAAVRQCTPMFAQRVPQRASRGGRARAKLAAQDSRLQQNATIRPAKSVAAEVCKINFAPSWCPCHCAITFASTPRSIARVINMRRSDQLRLHECGGWSAQGDFECNICGVIRNMWVDVLVSMRCNGL